MTDRQDQFFVPQWPVFYEDNHLLALYKPSGLLIQADRTEDPSLLEMAREWIGKRYAKPGKVFLGLVHRLDRPVAGVVLFGRTSKASGRLSDQFRRGVVEKQYVAVVEGVMENPRGRLVNELERVPRRSSRIVSEKTPRSREARLNFRVIDTDGQHSLVEIDLETGKHHQIRAQMAHIGHPVVGDLRYGGKYPLQHRQIALLAKKLTISHPTLGIRQTFTSPYPLDWPWGRLVEPDAPPWNWVQLQLPGRIL